MSRRREAALVAVLAVVTTVALTYPLAFQLGQGGRVDSEDGLFSIWNIAWVARTIVVDPAELFHANIFFPHRNTLAFSEASLVAGVLAVPAYWLTRNPYAAHNSAVLASFMLSLVGAYLLVRRLTGNRSAAAVSGVLFAFCPFVFARSAHIQLLMTAGLPFGMLAFHRLAAQPTLGRGVVLGLVMALAGLACGYYGLYAGLIVGVGILFYAARDGRWSSRAYWTAIVVAVVTGGVITGAGFLPYLEVAETHGAMTRNLDDARMYSADWRDYLASPARSHAWLLTRIEVWNEVLFPGFVMLGLAAVGVVTGRQDRARSEASLEALPREAGRPIVALYGTIALLAGWASFGPDGGLYTLLFETVPGFGLLRAPARLGIVTALALAVLAGVGVTRLTRGRRTAMLTAGLLAVALAELAAVPYPHFEAPRFPAAYRMLAQLPPGPIAEFPYFNRRMEYPRHAYYMVGSVTHWRPLVNGYSDVIPQDFRTEVNVVAGFPSAEAFDILTQHDTRYILLHRSLYDDVDWATLTDRVTAFSRRLRPIFWDTDARLYELVAEEH
ncbi:MAG: hypothetical protein O3A25_15295 [Acidobacteria bacterium]|nr:hypothetical protein [Acidobacteriota bacterium]